MRYSLDTSDWPLIINEDTDEGAVVALVQLPAGSTGDDETAKAAIKRVNKLLAQANREDVLGGLRRFVNNSK